MEQKKKRVRATLTQVRALEAELTKKKEEYRLQTVVNKHLTEELEAVKLKLKKTTEHLYEVGMKNGSVIKVSEGYRQEEVEILRKELSDCEKKLESQIDGTSMLVKDCDAWREKYRELLKMYEEQIDGTSRLVGDCDAWRETYRDLLKGYEELSNRHNKLKIDVNNAEYELERSVSASVYNDLKEKYDGLVNELSAKNMELKAMEEELSLVKHANKSICELNDERLAQIKHLKNRSFFERVFNK